MNEKGEVLFDSYAGKEYLGPHKVMNDLKKLLNDSFASVAAPAASGTSAPAAATADKPAPSDVKSPGGTNWDEVFKKKSPQN